jgi:hypothetical protein
MNFYMTTNDAYDGLASALIAAYSQPKVSEQVKKREAIEMPAVPFVAAVSEGRGQFLSVAA